MENLQARDVTLDEFSIINNRVLELLPKDMLRKKLLNKFSFLLVSWIVCFFIEAYKDDGKNNNIYRFSDNNK